MSASVWLRVATLADLAAAEGKLGLAAGGHAIALYRLDSAVLATEDSCPLDRTRLTEGALDGARIVCPRRHVFDLATGELRIGAPGGATLRRYAVKVEEDAIFVCTEE